MNDLAASYLVVHFPSGCYTPPCGLKEANGYLSSFIHAKGPVSNSLRLHGAGIHRDLLNHVVIIATNNAIKRNLLPGKNGLCDFGIAKIFLKMVLGR